MERPESIRVGGSLCPDAETFEREEMSDFSHFPPDISVLWECLNCGYFWNKYAHTDTCPHCNSGPLIVVNTNLRFKNE
jgi:Zn finger protein HypA/HybF involved in hydrogenase expression